MKLECVHVAAAALALGTGAGHALAGDIGLNLSFNAQVIRFAPDEPESYSLFPSANFTGFTDPKSQFNEVFIASDNGSFEALSSPTGGYSSSTGFVSFSSLYDSINDGMGWNVRVTDGATRAVFNYRFSLDGAALNANHMRPISFTGLMPGDEISTTPTIEWSVPPSTDPDIDYVDGFLGLSAVPPPPNFIDAFPGSARAWTPIAALPETTINLWVQLQTFPVDPAILVPTMPTTTDGPELDSFFFDNAYSSYAGLDGLLVVPTPGVTCVLALTVALPRRRRA